VALRDKGGAPLTGAEARLFQEIREHTMAALTPDSNDAGTVRASSQVAVRSGQPRTPGA
jgi:hypothetical protein